MPDVGLTYLLDIFTAVGPVEAAGMGVQPVSEETIGWWQRNRGIRLTPWEVDVVRGLSRVWLAQSHDSEDPACPPPFSAAPAAETRVKVAAQIDQLL